ESYMVHDGCKQEGIFFANYYLMPLREIVTHWKMGRDALLTRDPVVNIPPQKPDARINPTMWNSRWIPVLHNMGGDYLILDLDPTPKGDIGQLIEFYHEEGPTNVLAPGFGCWLSAYIQDLELGKYEFDEFSGMLRTR